VLHRELARVVARLLALPTGQVPAHDLLADLQAAWDNSGYAADLDFLEETAQRAIKATGPILECGSGLTTILLAVFAARRGVDVWVLEHSPTWAKRIEGVIRRCGLPPLRVLAYPIRDYGTFAWYDVPLAALPESFELVICDGPPVAMTPGGRYGLLPVLGPRLRTGSVILLDDAAGEEEGILRRWTIGDGNWVVNLKTSEHGTYAVLDHAAAPGMAPP
jgi:hypothetical protein